MPQNLFGSGMDGAFWNIGGIKMGIFDLFKPNIKKLEAKGDLSGLIKVLSKSLWDNERKEVLKAFVRIGEPAVDPLIFALNHKSWIVWDSTAEALGEIRDKRAVEPLIKALKDENWAVRVSVAKALYYIGDKRAIEPVVQSLEDLKALPFNEQIERCKEIIKVLVNFGWSPRNVEERIYSLIAKEKWDKLARLGKPAVKPLCQMLVDSSKYDYSESMTRIAADALVDIGDINALLPSKYSAKAKSLRSTLANYDPCVRALYDCIYELTQKLRGVYFKRWEDTMGNR
jgi:hypothetical protein